MTIVVDTYRVGRATAPAPANKTNAYAFSPVIAKAIAELPSDGVSAVQIPLPDGTARKNGFTRALRIFVKRNVEGEFSVTLTALGDEVQVMRERSDPTSS